MENEIKYYKVSIIAIFMMMMLSFIILNGFAYLIFTIIFKVPFEELYNKVWIILVFIPLTQGLIQPLTDRKGLLTIKNCNNFQLTHEKIGRLLVKKGYRELSKKDNSSTFEIISNFKKAVNLHKGHTILTREENTITVVGQKNILKSIESKIKWDKEL